MSDVEYYKKMMRQGETTDYTGGEFLGEQAKAHRTPTRSSKKKWGSQIERTNDDWACASAGKQRKSYVVKKKIVVPDINYSDDEEEKAEEEPAAAPTPAPKEEVKPVEVSPSSPTPAVEEKKEEDPEIAKYKAMMRQGDTTDYTSGEFLGEQGQAQARKSATTKKKWGKPMEHSVDEWMGASPGKQRKSYVFKSKPKTVVHHDDEKEKETTPVHSPVTKTATLAVEPKEVSPASSPVKAVEVDPAVEKYKAMMRQGDTTDYTSGEFLGEQAKAHRTPTRSSKKKWGSQIERSNDDWACASAGKQRKSYVIKE